MKVVILNGNPKSSNKRFDQYLDKLSSSLTNLGHEPFMFKLRDMKINNCIGCYSCWLKTPGICMHKDNYPEILKLYLKSDIALFSSPLIMGFVSALLKKVQERLLPISHPFLKVVDNRMQHIQRYKKYPSIALLLEKTGNFDEVNSQIIEKVFRSAKTRKFLFTEFMDKKPQEVADEINAF